jgi:TMEM164 family
VAKRYLALLKFLENSNSQLVFKFEGKIKFISYIVVAPDDSKLFKIRQQILARFPPKSANGHFFGRVNASLPCFSLREWLAWGLMAYGIWGFFHFLFLLPLAVWTGANLNSVLCPAISDPFRGPNYKLHALWHQVPYS